MRALILTDDARGQADERCYASHPPTVQASITIRGTGIGCVVLAVLRIACAEGWPGLGQSATFLCSLTLPKCMLSD